MIRLVKMIFLVTLYLAGTGTVRAECSEAFTDTGFVASDSVVLAKFIDLHANVMAAGGPSFEYDDPERLNFKRWPETRKGTRITELTTEGRIKLHDVMNDLLSSSGYLKLLGITSNEDGPGRTDDLLGREAYWITFFGQPTENAPWGMRFEGHHVSLNFTFRGKYLLSNSPQMFGAYPAIMQHGKFSPYDSSDVYREGYQVLYEEDELFREFLRNAGPAVLEKSRLRDESRLVAEDNSIVEMDSILAELNRENFITVADFDEKLSEQVNSLIKVYFANFKFNQVRPEELDLPKIRFAHNASAELKKIYYRIFSEEFIIEFENRNNHIHYIFRDLRNDFGNQVDGD
ncbi:DUF3500 domain-containing protein [Neolewinella antarctica]|uniref:DUF3500 domain-containing protein n=1 Tax=Neolewinella antarctica TaxID=442734 RepID=A0ABX0XD30_9BACT|nr:DUF3500 domain-containing protein [Neolewinella antarctica]NJC27204.1 hypothetical protein [Neolewinella antarctica]